MPDPRDQDRLRVLAELGFRPNKLAWYQEKICEIISYPFWGTVPRINIRTIPKDPMSMISVDCSEVETLQILANNIELAQERARRFFTEAAKHFEIDSTDQEP